MAITQTIATLPAVLNDSATFYEDIAERNNSLVTTILPSINAWATQANTTQTEINAKALQVAAQAVDGGYSQDYINTNFVGVNNAQTIAGIKTFSSSPIVPTPTTGTQAANKNYADLKVALTDFTGGNQNLTGNGYQKLPGGLIIQWGIVVSNVSSNVGITWTFPIAFPTASLQVFGTHENGGSPTEKAMVNVYTSSSTTATLNLSASGTQNIRMLAIGY